MYRLAKHALLVGRVWVRCAPSLLFYYTEPKMTKWYNRLFSVAKAPTMLAKMRLEEFAVRMQRDCPLPPIYYQVRQYTAWGLMRALGLAVVPLACQAQDPVLLLRLKEVVCWCVLQQRHANCASLAQL